MREAKLKKIDEKYGKLALVPAWLLMPLWLVSLVLPNLIYSGVKFADTLHILKWAVTGVPIGIAVLVAGARLLRYGRERVTLKFDVFSIIWAIILIYCALQPLWVNVFSPTGYVLEMVCFVTVWAFYVLSVSSFPDWGLKYVLLLGNINAAINVGFAELQIRNLNNLSFLGLEEISSIILPTPGNYIGNTAQQNMFGLWTAVATLGAVYLLVYELKNDKRKFLTIFTTILMAVNFWGLMNSTSRSATIALIIGLLVLLLMALTKFDRSYMIRFGAAMMILGAVFYVSLYSPRSEQIVDKTVEIVRHAENIGNRRGIWMTSWAMFLEHPEGVGVGQYKWHYLEGQRAGFKLNNADWYRWQYTHWAHNEFLQFFCEGGVIGGILLLLMWLAWFFPAIIALLKRKSVSINSVWALSLVMLITFTAIFTRPFHRIENMVWIALGFALSNREFFGEKLSFDVLKQKSVRKIAGIVCIVSSIAGFVYISSGIYGNYILRKALSTTNGSLQLHYLNEAEKHPITREEALRNIGYHHIQIGEQTNNPQELVNGFNILWEHFQREAKSEDIGRLLELSQRYQIEPVLREIASYFKPGTYHLKRIPQKDSAGRVINALLLVNGPGSDDK